VYVPAAMSVRDTARTWCYSLSLRDALPILSLLVIPLVNVVLAAVPADVAGGAGGQFSTAQQLGGALGVAAVGTVFFSALESRGRSEEHTSELQSRENLVCRLLLEKKKRTSN